ncbi:MAG: hypothetical protein ACYDEY_10680 [Acidimicrobiales bacterium]
MIIIARLRTLAWNLIRGVLPYPDIFRRQRIRTAARELVRCDPWPGNDATALQMTELSLLRALWIQRSTHRALRWRQVEAAALLARTAVENCITGLYLLYAEDPMDKLRGENSLAIKRLFQYLLDCGVVTQGLIDTARDSVGGSGQLPSVSKMADVVANAAKYELTRDLYGRFYVPLSTLFAHGNGLALLRHVRSDASLRDRPVYPWARRSAVRTADACVGILALAVATRSGLAVDEFANYANAHMKRALVPLPIMAGQGRWTSIRLRLVPQAIRELRAGIEYHASVERKNDPWEVRIQWTRQNLARVLEMFDLAVGEETFELILDEFALMMIGPRPGESANESKDS